MPLYLTILLLTTFTLLFVIYSKWQFSDDRGESSGKWHPWGMAMRISVVAIALLLSLFPADWRDILLAAMIQLPIWDIGINLIALRVRALYLGGTAKTDSLKAKKWLLMFIGIALAVAVKTFIHFSNKDILSWVR